MSPRKRIRGEARFLIISCLGFAVQRLQGQALHSFRIPDEQCSSRRILQRTLACGVGNPPGVPPACGEVPPDASGVSRLWGGAHDAPLLPAAVLTASLPAAKTGAMMAYFGTLRVRSLQAQRKKYLPQKTAAPRRRLVLRDDCSV